MIAEYTYTEPDNVPTETLARTYVTLDTPPGDAGFQRVCVGGESRVNGSQYIDERVVMRDHVGSAEAPGPRDYYYLHQELYSVAGLARANGSLAEACVYETYGQARIYSWPNEDLNRNGSADPVDLSYLSANKTGSGVATDKPYMDFDMDGDVDTDDELELDADLDGLVDASADALEVDVSPAGNPFLFTGRPADHLRTVQVIGSIERRRIQDNRNRTYDPKHGRWLQRDPAGLILSPRQRVLDFSRAYLDGMSLYQYVCSGPTYWLDPEGEGVVLPGPRPPLPPGWPRDPQEPRGLPFQVGSITFDVEGCQSCASLSIAIGVYMYRTGELRLEHDELVRALEFKGLTQDEGSAARTALQEQYNKIQTELGKQYTEVYREFKPKKPPGQGTYWKPSPIASSHAKIFKRVGKCVIVVGVAVDIAAIATAGEGRYAEVTVKTVASNAGAIVGTPAGAWAGAKVGGLCGTWGGPVGMVVGALAGGCVGAWTGEIVAETVYDKVVGD